MLKKHEHHHRTGRPIKNVYSSNTRQMGGVFQVMEPPKSSSILRKSSDIRKPIRCVKNSRKPLHVTQTLETKILRSEWLAQVNLISVTPTLQKFEYRSQEETERQEQGAREAAWKLGKSVLKLKEHERATFFTPSENRCLPASTLKPEEREFVVGSGASMHMISNNDLSDAEMDTLTKSCSPTIVITANNEVQTHEEATVYVKELGIFSRKHASSIVAWKALRWKRVFLWMDQRSKTTSHFKTGFGYSATRRTSFLSWFQACQRVRPPVVIIQLQRHLQDRKGIVLHLLQARLLHQRQQHQVTVRLEKERIEMKMILLPCLCQVSMLMIERGNPLFAADSGMRSQANQNPKTNKEETTIERGNPLFADSGRAPLSSEIPDWLQEFRENIVDERVPEHRDSHASSSHEVSLELTSERSEDSGKHSVYTHFPIDRNCEICKRTKITRAPCRRRIGGAVPRAENFGDLITAGHKVLNENCESRNNHRCAIVVQDLAAQWIQSYPCKTKTSQETQRSLQKFLEPDRKPKVTYTDNSLEFGKACEDLSWNHCTSTPHWSETNGIAERAVRRVKEGTSAVLLQSGLNENWWADSMECFTYLRNVTDLLSDGKTPYERRFGQPFQGPIIPFGSLVEYWPFTAKYQSRIHQFGKKVLPGLFLGYALYAGVNLVGWHIGCRPWGVGGDGRIGNVLKKTQCERGDISQRKKENLFFQSQMDESNHLEEIKTWEHPLRYGIDQFKEKVTLIFLENQEGLFHHLLTHFRMPVKR